MSQIEKFYLDLFIVIIIIIIAFLVDPSLPLPIPFLMLTSSTPVLHAVRPGESGTVSSRSLCTVTFCSHWRPGRPGCQEKSKKTSLKNKKIKKQSFLLRKRKECKKEERRKRWATNRKGKNRKKSFQFTWCFPDPGCSNSKISRVGTDTSEVGILREYGETSLKRKVKFGENKL